MKIIWKVFLIFCIGTNTAWAEMVMTPPPILKPIDARRTFPMIPASSWNDGFFLIHPTVSDSDFGFHARINLMYNREPFGVEPDSYVLRDRFGGSAALLISIKGMAEIGATLPFTLYQNTDQPAVPHLAQGDVHLLLKARMPFPTKWPQIGVLADVGINTSRDGSYLGAGQTSGSVRVLAKSPELKIGSAALVGTVNLGGFFGGTQPPCQITAMDMPMTPDGCGNGKGLGTQFLYGFGPTLIIPSQSEWMTRISMELNGSVPITSDEGRNPLLFSVGLQSIRKKETYLGISYSYGITQGSPHHTGLLSLGWIYDYVKKQPEKPKPEGIQVTICTDKDGRVLGLPPDGKTCPTGPTNAPAAGAGKPTGPTSLPQKQTLDVPLPPGLIPQGGSK